MRRIALSFLRNGLNLYATYIKFLKTHLSAIGTNPIKEKQNEQ